MGTRHKLGYLVPPLSLTERQITLEVRQCKADIDIHHGEHGEHGVPCTEVRGNNILSPWYNPDMITIISNRKLILLKNTFIHYSFCVLLVDLSGILIGLRDPTTKQTNTKNKQ